MVTLDTGENDLLSLERVRAFFWSPDGSKIAFLVDSVGPRINASLSNLRRGRGRVLNQFQPGREMELWVVDIATGNSRLLTTFTPTPIFLLQFLPFFDQYALSHRLWSPDSTALVIPTLQDETPHLMVVPVNGGSPDVLRVGDMAFWSHQ
jgi:TolB protein